MYEWSMLDGPNIQQENVFTGADNNDGSRARQSVNLWGRNLSQYWPIIYAGVSEGQGQPGVNHNNRGVLFDPTQHEAGQLDPA